MFFFIILGSIVVGDILWWWWAHRRLREVRRSALWRTLLGLFMGLMLGYIAFMFISPQTARQSQSILPLPVVLMVYVWHLLILPAAVLLVWGGQVVKLVVRLIRRFRPAEPQAAQSLDGPSSGVQAGRALTRREALIATAVALPPLATVGVVARAMTQLDALRVREMHLSFPQLPGAFDGVVIAHISDMHVGRWTRGMGLREIIETSNRLRPDLVLMTGDLIDLSLRDLPRAIDAVKQLESRYGTYMCEGNHDLFDSRAGFEMGVKQSGVPLLIDETTTIDVRGEPLQLLGLRWGRGEEAIRQSSANLASIMHRGVFRILLAHHPHAFDHTAAELTLAGHTHGGQLMLTDDVGAGPAMFRYWSGHYRRGGQSLVVSNGAGNWFPVRMNAPAEIVKITLHRT